MNIPKIIHQIWGGDKTLPVYFQNFANTWKKMNPSWKYEFWDDNKILSLVEDSYPEYLRMFQAFPYNMQRWDTVRYFILDKLGGLYADFDSECLKPLDGLSSNTTFWTSQEPEEYALRNEKDIYLSTAIMGAEPSHPFVRRMIENIFSYSFKNEKYILDYNSKTAEVVNSTGPLMLTLTYEQYPDKSLVQLISRDDIASYTTEETVSILKGIESEILDKRIEGAFAVHYFFNNWMTGNS